ncbi:MAG: malto-oligosyltrehalose synthase, partial [Endomicrobiales bacterium]
MNIPSATYRLQFSPLFRFPDALQLLDYLKTLGIGGVYASPVFKARPGSTHGYDIIDPTSLNPELGGSDDFDALAAAVSSRGFVWLQDIVPNHVAYSGDNGMLMDVLEKGRGSKFFDFFDVDWNYPYENMNGKVLAPFLGKFYGETLQNGELTLKYDEGGLSVNYYGLRFPLKMESYVKVFSFNLGRLKHDLGGDHPDFIKLLGILYTLKNLPSTEELRELYDHVGFVKKLLWDLYRRNESIRFFIDQSLEMLNGKPGKAESFDLLDALLCEQYYRLSFWKVASEELNYRRFFNINDLISLKVENGRVFEYVHSLTFSLVREGKAGALRIDHIDGLYDPLKYLRTLREKLGDLYIVVEKILAFGEELPSSWPVQGTTGYDFLNYVNSLFCERDNEELFNRIYRRVIGYEMRYDNLIFEKKRLIIGKYMAGDIDELARLIKQFISRERDGIDITMYGLKRALVDVLALFPVYRTYLSGEMTSERDLSVMRQVIEAAKEVNPGLMNELNLIGRFLLLDIKGNEPGERKKQWLHIVMRFQQYTGPLMAKGFEDTALYVYNRLLSLNEVGG